jgi:hypothetical protein
MSKWVKFLVDYEYEGNANTWFKARGEYVVSDEYAEALEKKGVAKIFNKDRFIIEPAESEKEIQVEENEQEQKESDHITS